MDNSLVLFRTAAGEAAVEQPTRLVQRNLRTALKLVDGQRQVADIVARFGDIAVGEAALADLLRSGLIESADAPGHGDTGHAAPGKRSTREAPLGSRGKVLPSQIVETDPRAANGIVERITISDVEPKEGFSPRSPQPAPSAAQRHEARPAPSRAASATAARATAPSTIETKPGPTVRRRERRARTQRNWASSALALVLLAVLSVIAGLRYYPYERHVPQLERELSELLGQPVAIGRLSVSFAPYPSVALDDVGIGADRRITVASLRFLPDPLSLTGDRPVVRDLRLEGADVAARDLELLLGLLSGAGSGTGIAIHGLRFTDLTLRFPETVVAGLQGEAAGDRMNALRFALDGGALSGEVSVAENGLRLRLIAQAGWSPAFLAPLAFDHFDAEGRLAQDTLHLEKVYARLADGSVAGSAKVMLGAASRISAELEMKHLSLDKLLAVSKAEISARGSASGMLRVGGPTARTESGVGLVFEGNVQVNNGSLQGFDLVEAVRSGSRGAVRGGSTRFEEFAGQVRVDRNAWRISRLRLQSGLLRADGQIAGGRGREVAGLVNVELRGSAGSLRVPVAVTGSLSNPVLTASQGARAATAPESS